jgi:hypothetical protein
VSTPAPKKNRHESGSTFFFCGFGFSDPLHSPLANELHDLFVLLLRVLLNILIIYQPYHNNLLEILDLDGDMTEECHKRDENAADYEFLNGMFSLIVGQDMP